MKKIILVLCVINAACASVHAQLGKLAIIEGFNRRNMKLPITLYNVKDGERVAYATTNLDEKGSFGFAIPNCPEGFYYLGDSIEINTSRIYLKPGDYVNLTMKDKGDFVINTGSAENRILDEWKNFSKLVSTPAAYGGDTSNFETYFPLYEAFVPKAKAFKKKIHTANGKFNRLMNETVDIDMELWALRYLVSPHPGPRPSAEQFTSSYQRIAETSRFNRASLLLNGDLISLFNFFSIYKLLFLGKHSMAKATPNDVLQAMMPLIANDTLKGVYIANNLTHFKTYQTFIDFTDSLKKYFLTPGSLEKYTAAFRKVATFGKGSRAYNFQYGDTKDKLVSLESFKGKVVVIDIWATWCGPCIAEIPHLKKLEEEMNESNAPVEFVSISIDGSEEKQKWLDFVKAKSLSGTQLYANGKYDMMEFYDIKTIPRFMVIDQKGNIVTANAPKPSTPQFKKLLLQTLAENKTTALTK